MSMHSYNKQKRIKTIFLIGKIFKFLIYKSSMGRYLLNFNYFKHTERDNFLNFERTGELQRH